MKNSQYSTYVNLFRLFLVLAIAAAPFVWFCSNDIIFIIGLGCYSASSYFKTLYQEIEIKELKDKLANREKIDNEVV